MLQLDVCRRYAQPVDAGYLVPVTRRWACAQGPSSCLAATLAPATWCGDTGVQLQQGGLSSYSRLLWVVEDGPLPGVRLVRSDACPGLYLSLTVRWQTRGPRAWGGSGSSRRLHG